MGLRWLVEHCSHADVIVKVDDDILLNPHQIENYLLPKFKGITKKIGCDMFVAHASPIQRTGKWKVDANQFMGLKGYPYEYCKGYFVALSPDLLLPMLHAARLNPFFWVDDFYLFGVLPATVGGVNMVYYAPVISINHVKGYICLSDKGRNCEYLAVTPSRHFPWPEGQLEMCRRRGFKPDGCMFYLRDQWTEAEAADMWALMRTPDGVHNSTRGRHEEIEKEREKKKTQRVIYRRRSISNKNDS